MVTDLNTLIDQDFRVDSYCELMEHCQKKANSFLGFIQQLIDTANPDNDTPSIDFPSDYIITNALRNIGLDDSTTIATDGGFTTVGSFVHQFMSIYSQYYAGVIDDLGSTEIILSDSLGNQVSETFNDVLDSIKTNLYASMAENFALQAAKNESISDRISFFNTMIASKLDTGDPSVMSSINYYKEKLLSNTTPYELFDSFMKSNGASQLDAQQTNLCLKDFDVSAYTGADPLGTLSFTCFKTGAETVGKIVGAAAVGIWSAIKKGANWVWNKAKKYTVEIFDNPYDVTDNGNSQAKYCFDFFQYQREYTDWAYISGSENKVLLTDTPWSYGEVSDIAQQTINHWYLIKTIAGEVAINPSAVRVIQDSQNEDLLTIDYKGTVLFKPYSLKSSYRYDTYAHLIEDAQSDTQGMYLDTNASENDLFNAFTFGSEITKEILEKLASEISNGAFSSTWNPYWTTPGAGYQITNLDWLTKATGYHVDGHGNTLFDNCTYCNANLAKMGSALLIMVIMSMVKTNNYYSQMFDEFVPFVKDTQQMSQGRFGIKTDSQNQDVANAFTVAIVAIVIIAVVVITGAVIVKKISRKLFWKRTQFIATSDSAMWDGEVLDAAKKRKYIRYSRKLNASQILSKGVAAAESLGDKLSSMKDTITTTLCNVISGENSNNDQITLATIKSLIK